jgi:uncharacterized protein DUF6535
VVLVSVSYQDLKPNSRDTSAFYLANINQPLADPDLNASASSVPLHPPAFSPPKHVIWVNSLWILSLAVSLTCALLATLLQQWARRYLKITQPPPHYSPHKRARIRAFFSDGVHKLRLPAVAEALPTLLHLALFLFFAGLLVDLFNVNLTVFIALVCWFGLSGVVYACLTLMPIFRHDSPYYTPLSSSAWSLHTTISYAVFQILSMGTEKNAEEVAFEPPAAIDGRILQSTIDAMDDDDDKLEQFFELIPGFFSSKLVDDPRRILDGSPLRTFVGCLSGFLDRTLSSSSVAESVKTRRFVTCFNAADATSTGIDREFFHGVFSGRWDGVLQSVEMGHYLRSRANNHDRETDLYTQGINAGIIASVRDRDDRWSALATEQLCVSRSVLQDYAAHGDSVLLANLNHITRKILRTFEGDHYAAYISSRILRSISRFNIQHTLPVLQHDFCAVWNDVVEEARKSGSDSTPIYILRYIRHLYIALHQGTDASPTLFSSSTADHDDILFHDSSYPLCNIAGHDPDIAGESTRISPAISYIDLYPRTT